MNNECVFAVLGCGNGGMALAGKIASQGYLVNIFESLAPTTEFLKLSAEKEIFLKGEVTGRGIINKITTDMEEAVNDVDVILIVVPAFAHEMIFEQLLPYLRDGHKIVIIPGNYGTLRLRKMMAEHGIRQDITVSELASLPYACRTIAYNTVEVYKHKQKMKIGTWPMTRNDEILTIMNRIMDIFIPGGNVVEMSLDNINCVLHPLPVLLNVGAIETNSEKFRHYINGISPLISEKIHAMDEERLAIGRQYSLQLLPVLEQLKMYYGDNASRNVYEYVNSAQSPYKELFGQKVDSRYLTEDVPCLVVPSMQLGHAVGIRTPWFEMCVRLASQLHEADYLHSGTTLDKLGIEKLNEEELKNYISKE